MSSETPHFVICIPVYNDWDVVGLLLGRMDRVLSQQRGNFSVLLVDDGSDEDVPKKATATWTAFKKVEILKLRRNLGHQRAIAIGLSHIFAHQPCEAVVVMDGDGQDAPEQVAVLLEKYNEHKKVIFAKRTKRSESLLFTVLYHSYRMLHWLLTGRKVEVGNFSVVPFSELKRLMGASELWNHYAAAVMKTRIAVEKIPLPRAQRIRSRSKMNFVDLVMHGLSGISVFSEEMCVRFLIFTATFIGLVLAAIAVMASLSCSNSVPVWAMIIAGLLFLGLVNAFVLAFIFAFVILQRRSNSNFLPLRDFEHYVMETVSLV